MSLPSLLAKIANSTFIPTEQVHGGIVIGVYLGAVLCLVVFVYHSFWGGLPELSESDDGALLDRLSDFCPKPLGGEGDMQDKKIETLTVGEFSEQGIDFAKVNYLNMLNSQRIKETAIDCIQKYGVGTCGPRGFFGTTEVHLQLEAALADFLGMEEAIVYSYGFAAPSNAVLAYCKKGDVIFCDEKINFALEQGIIATKSILVYFKHNSVSDLCRKLEDASKHDSPICSMRKFLIIEGIYAKTGTVCPLADLIALARLYQLRIFLDESISFGVLGATGRGVTEHFDISISEVDMVVGSLEGALGSVGGFCASSKAHIEHQRLSSSGYVFSASLPTFQAQAAIEALKMIENSPNELWRLQLLSRKVHKFLSSSTYYEVQSSPISPYKVFNFKQVDKRRECERDICRYCRANGVYLIAGENGLVINLNVSLYYQKSKLTNAFKVLQYAAESVKM